MQEVIIQAELNDVGGEPVVDKLKVAIKITDRGVFINMAGYGEKTARAGHGEPVMLEFADGVPRVIAWADINQEDPTHIIELGGASEDEREFDEDDHPKLEEAAAALAESGEYQYRRSMVIRPAPGDGYTITGHDRFDTLNEALYNADEWADEEEDAS